MKSILITGAAGYIGQKLLKRLSSRAKELGISKIIAADVRGIVLSAFEPNGAELVYQKLDVRDDGATEIFQKHQVDGVVHLASIVTPGKNSNRDFEYSVDVDGTKNILKACVQAKVKRIIVSSSGAAYGYHPENVKILTEADPIRGNFEFPYSYHKRLVEEELARYRVEHPELEQIIFRIGTVLGPNTKNQITDLFAKPVQIGVSGTESRFNFIWDEDVVRCFEQAVVSEKTGIFNLIGDGSLTLHERAKLLGKPVLQIPAVLLQSALWLLKKLNLTQYGPEQILFLKYRPVLDNLKLKSEFGFQPTWTSREVFEKYVRRQFPL